MLVCHCKGQTEAIIRQCISDGAHTEEEVGARCGAGTKCGGCLPALEQLLEESMAMRLEQLQAPHSAA